MKFNFRKITSVLASAVMLGSTAGLAAAATNYPAPFVKGGAADVAVVVGSAAASSDYLAAVDLGQNLQAELAKQTATTGDGSGATASGGDSINMATTSRKLYYGDAINAARSSLSATNLPSLLADGSFTDLTGTAYPYTQTIIPGNTVSVFGTSGGDLDDPVLYYDVGTTASASLYNYTLSFSKNVNVSDSTNVQGRTIKIMGVDYVIGSGSTNTTLYLQGAGETITVNAGEAKTVTVSGVEHTIELITTSSATQGKISVDGSARDVVEGNKYTFAGGVVVYVKSVDHPAFAGDVRDVELIIGANALKIDNGATVKKGTDETSIKGTLAYLTAAGTGIISGLTVQVADARSQADHLAVGESFTDPVFGGLKVQFAGAVPALDAATRAKIVVSTDNNQYGYVTFTSARAGTSGEKRLTYAYDSNTASGSIYPILAHQSNTSANKGVIHVYEGENAQINDWIVVNQGDSGTILEVTDISIDTATSGSVTFEDAITGETQKITLTNDTAQYSKSAVNFFGGNGYTIKANQAGTSVNITWSAAGRVLFPRIKLKDGGWIALLAPTSVANNSAIIFPTGETSLSTTATTVTNVTTAGPAGGITYTGTAGASAMTITGISSPACSFGANSSTGPAILFFEPKKWDDSAYGNTICVPMFGSSGTTEVSIGSPVINGTNSGLLTLTSDTYKQQAVDKYGSLVSMESRTNENGVVTINYPLSQMYLDVLFTSEGAVVTPGSSGGTGSVVELGSVTVKDSEVSSVSEKNLIVVGGSCVNNVASKLLGGTGALCGAAFTDKSGVGADEFLVEAFDSPYSTGKVAMLVAGYEAADTTKAVKYVITNRPATDVGTKVHKKTQTEADVTSA